MLVRATLGLVLCALACGLGEFQVNTYPTLAEARSDRLFERGWVPDVLPPGAGPIVEAHDIDTNARCSRSSFPSESSARVAQALRAIGFETYSGELPPLPFSRCPFSIEHAQATGAALRNANGSASSRGVAVVAEGVLYFWSS